ncbi:hypothetical protein M885DRAFT_478875 [Pelagophyceae sp. CCMP2097]|nr:hypothetical protein M885DRAFT_478875 [Pelagophyceae sp. CCMP2097]
MTEVYDVITTALIEETTGVSAAEHGLLDELEIIFMTIKTCASDADAAEAPQGLHKCSRLRKLSLIDCGLETIGSLRPVSQTLERLCLADQRLTRISGLGALPQLRQLYLQQNAITKLEGLDELPRLRTLWAFSNKIGRMEGLHANAELRELWLQSNRLVRLGGLDSLVQLRDLHVSGNRIADFRDLARLAKLPQLEAASFKDVHFGACPVSARTGYRDAVLTALPQLRALDATEVTRQERAAARDAQLEHVFEFNERVDLLAREQRLESAAIDARRRRTGAHAEALDAEMRAAFAQLEALVREGRGAIAREHASQRRARALSSKALDTSLTAALAEHAAACAAAARHEAARLSRGEVALEALERRARGERRAALLIAGLQYGDGTKPPRANCQLLGEHSPDFKCLNAKVSLPQLRAAVGKEPGLQLQLLRAYRVCLDGNSAPEGAVVAEAAKRLVFFCAGGDDVEALLRGELKRSVILYASAADAVAAFVAGLRRAGVSPYRQPPDPGGSSGDAARASRLAEGVLLADEARPRGAPETAEEEDDYAADSDQDDDDAGDDAVLDACASGVLALVVSCSSAAATEVRDDGDDDEVLVLRCAGRCVSTPTRLAAPPAERLHVEHLLLVGSDLVARVLSTAAGPSSWDAPAFRRDPRRLETELLRDDDDPEAALAELETRVSDELRRYRERVSMEVDPARADVLRAVALDLAEQDAALRDRRSDIETERAAQEALLRAFDTAGNRARQSPEGIQRHESTGALKRRS